MRSLFTNSIELVNHLVLIRMPSDCDRVKRETVGILPRAIMRAIFLSDDGGSI